MKSNGGEEKGLRCEDLVLGESKHQTLEDLVGYRHSGLPQRWSQVVRRSFRALARELREGCLKINITYKYDEDCIPWHENFVQAV